MVNAQDNERYSMIRLFETFIHSLSCVSSQDAYLLNHPVRTPFSFRLASTLQKELMPQLPSHYYIDMGIKATDNPKALVPDIIIHNRNDEKRETILAIVCRSGYLSESELIGLHTLKNSSDCDLTLAVAILPSQKYLLIYRSDEMFVDYYHFYIEHQHCSFLKRREIGDLEIDEKQLTLPISSKKKAVPRQ